MTKRVYVASHSREEAEEVASHLRGHGFTITSRWHGKEFLPTGNHTVSERIDIAIEDVSDVRDCDVLVLIAGPEKYSGGKFVEAGIALGLGKLVVVLGRRENMLLWLPEIVAVDDMAELPEVLG